MDRTRGDAQDRESVEALFVTVAVLIDRQDIYLVPLFG